MARIPAEAEGETVRSLFGSSGLSRRRNCSQPLWQLRQKPKAKLFAASLAVTAEAEGKSFADC